MTDRPPQEPLFRRGVGTVFATVLIVALTALAAYSARPWVVGWFPSQESNPAPVIQTADGQVVKIEIPAEEIAGVAKEVAREVLAEEFEDRFTVEIKSFAEDLDEVEGRVGAVQTAIRPLVGLPDLLAQAKADLDKRHDEFVAEFAEFRQKTEEQFSEIYTELDEQYEELGSIGRGLAANAKMDAAETERVDREITSLKAEVARLKDRLSAVEEPPEVKVPAPPAGEVTTNEEEDMNRLFAATMVALTLSLPLSTLQAEAATPTTNPTDWMDKIDRSCPPGTQIDIATVKQFSDDQLDMIVKRCQELQASGIFDANGNVVDEPAPMTIAPPPPAINTAAVYGGGPATQQGAGSHNGCPDGYLPLIKNNKPVSCFFRDDNPENMQAFGVSAGECAGLESGAHFTRDVVNPNTGQKGQARYTCP